MPTIDDVISISPTLTADSALRGGAGVFGASRGPGKTHQGVDIVANQSSNDKSTYQVRAVSAGQIAYAQINGSATTGYGYTVAIDHQNGFYTLYAHLSIAPSQGLVAIGQAVALGDIIGYMADLSTGQMSSGNVWSDVVAPFDKIQLHIECFEAPSGRTSTTTLSVLKQDCTIDDPTARLNALGYVTFANP